MQDAEDGQLRAASYGERTSRELPRVAKPQIVTKYEPHTVGRPRTRIVRKPRAHPERSSRRFLAIISTYAASLKHDRLGHVSLTCGFARAPPRAAPPRPRLPLQRDKNFNLCAHKLKFLPRSANFPFIEGVRTACRRRMLDAHARQHASARVTCGELRAGSRRTPAGGCAQPADACGGARVLTNRQLASRGGEPGGRFFEASWQEFQLMRQASRHDQSAHIF